VSALIVRVLPRKRKVVVFLSENSVFFSRTASPSVDARLPDAMNVVLSRFPNVFYFGLGVIYNKRALIFDLV
jgi:hypothetical protein